MANPEFRKGSAGGRESGRGSGRFGAPGPLPESPFSQTQILHLMKTEFARGRRYGFPVSCILLQVDRLMPLVDLYGVALRDTVRRQIGRLVTDKTRGADHLGLMNDDRYLLVLPHAAEADAQRVAERILHAFGDLEVESGGNILSLTLSVGVASSEEQQTMFFDTILSQAEAALTWATEAGGNQATVFRPERAREIVDEDVPPGPEHEDVPPGPEHEDVPPGPENRDA